MIDFYALSLCLNTAICIIKVTLYSSINTFIAISKDKTKLNNEIQRRPYPFLSNFLYSFYSRSHKRFGWLNDYLKENDYKPFKLNYIDEVRWVASHRSAVKKIYDHLPELIGHLTEIVNNREPTHQNH